MRWDTEVRAPKSRVRGLLRLLSTAVLLSVRRRTYRTEEKKVSSNYGVTYDGYCGKLNLYSSIRVQK